MRPPSNDANHASRIALLNTSDSNGVEAINACPPGTGIFSASLAHLLKNSNTR